MKLDNNKINLQQLIVLHETIYYDYLSPYNFADYNLNCKDIKSHLNTQFLILSFIDKGLEWFQTKTYNKCSNRKDIVFLYYIIPLVRIKVSGKNLNHEPVIYLSYCLIKWRFRF